MTETLLDLIETKLVAAATFNENAEEAPSVLLWPDRESQFAPVVDAIREKLPIHTLGDFNPEQRQGPAYWLRCVVAGTIETDAPAGTPIVYLPGVGREGLRAIEDCPRDVAPIAGLQYRGEWFAHRNGKDWTIRSLLLNNEQGLGFDVAEDAATQQALLDALPRLLTLPAYRLADTRITAAFLHDILSPDQPEAMLLAWLDDPVGYRAGLDGAEWRAFVAQAKNAFAFDPDSQGEITGARLLGERKPPWDQVWNRFEREPSSYLGIGERLRQARPGALFVGEPGSWPQENEEAEDDLRRRLLALDGAAPAKTRAEIADLWENHEPRRRWVWARLERAPLLMALERLKQLSESASSGPVGRLDDLVAEYTQVGWKADAAFLAALGAVEGNDRTAVAAAGKALYRPWAESHALALQDAVVTHKDSYLAGPESDASAGVVTVFVDGLRLDLAHQLQAMLAHLRVDVTTSLAALPTVTETSKSALAPVPSGSLKGGADLGPARASNGAKASVSVLRGLMAERGLQVLQGTETGDPSGMAWTEAADIDARGHQFGASFVDEVDGELRGLSKRIQLLLDAGWNQVHVVTDHGWLLLPGGLEKVELPVATAEKKKGRCARLKPGAVVGVPTVPWHWDPAVRIAIAPGISCFEANKEYEHGGISLQECVVPRMVVSAGADRRVTGGATIAMIKWVGLRCRIEFDNVPPGVTVDIRTSERDPSTSIAESSKETNMAGKATLLVANDEYFEQPAYIVIVASDGGILTQRAVVVGSNR